MRTEPSYSDIIKLGMLGNQNEMALTQTFFNLIYGKKSTCLRGLSQITFALRVGRWSEKRVVCYIKSAN